MVWPMELHFRPGLRDDQLVAVVVGDLDLYASVGFANALMAKLGSGTRRLLLDLHDLRYLDSSGVGALIRLLQKCRAEGGELRVVNLSGTPKKVLEMSNIISLLKQSPSVEAALEAWS